MSRPIKLPGLIGDLARAFPGGLNGLAAHLRVHRSTIARWAKQGRAEGPAAVLIEELLTQYGLTPSTPSTTRTK